MPGARLLGLGICDMLSYVSAESEGKVAELGSELVLVGLSNQAELDTVEADLMANLCLWLLVLDLI